MNRTADKSTLRLWLRSVRGFPKLCAPEKVEKLFEPFSDSTTGGTGLGLSIVYQIVRDHNGTINGRSLENSGTTIPVELPTEINNQIISSASGDEEKIFIPSRLEDFLNVKEKETEVSS